MKLKEAIILKEGPMLREAVNSIHTAIYKELHRLDTIADRAEFLNTVIEIAEKERKYVLRFDVEK